MQELNGYIKLHRKLVQWGWYSDVAVKSVFIHLLMVATFKDSQYMGYRLKPGQSIIGRKKMADELGLSEQQVRTALKKLESTGEISLFSTNRFTIATVENWKFYQGEEKRSNQQATNKQPTDNQQATNKQPHLKNVKNVKKVKNVKNVCVDTPDTHTNFESFGILKNVMLTSDEYRELCGTYEHAKKLIDKVSVWLPDHPGVKHHYAKCLKFAANDNWPKRQRVESAPTEPKLPSEPMPEDMKQELKEKYGTVFKDVPE